MSNTVVIQPGDFISIFYHHKALIEEDCKELLAYMYSKDNISRESNSFLPPESNDTYLYHFD
jgi:hypothetical protein